MLLPLLFAICFAYSAAESVSFMPVVFPEQAVNFYADKAIVTQCNSVAFQACQVKFNTYLGIQDTLDWHDSATFYAAINSRLYNNTAGLIRVCGAYSLFYQCLGTSYKSCINPLTFISNGYSITQSFQYVQAIHALSFKCAGGLEQGVMKWAGIIQVITTQTAALNSCFNTFNSSINSDFSNYCTAVFHLENCFSSIFTSLGSEVVWWACEDIRVGFSYTFCPDSGNLVCRLLRFRQEANENTHSHIEDEHDKYRVNIGMSKIILDYPPKPDEETA